MPPELQVYYTDLIDIAKEQEAMLALTRYVLINIDEFDLQSTEERLLLHYFEPTDNEDDGKWMSPTKIYLV